MQYLHTMVRVSDLEQSLAFYQDVLGLVEVRRKEYPQGAFTLVFLCTPTDVEKYGKAAPSLELTWNWNESGYTSGRNFGHIAYSVDNLYDYCQQLMDKGITLNRPPKDGHMAFIRSPDGISIELIQRGDPLAPQEPWVSMPNTGTW